MWDIFLKIWFFLFILPLSAFEEGYEMFKKYMTKHDYHPDWTDTALVALIVLFFIVLLLLYGYK